MFDSLFSHKTALVTGATGFVGSHLVGRLVKEGVNVHIVCRPQSSLQTLARVTEDISVHRVSTSDDSLRKAINDVKPEIVFHLASLFVAEHKPEQVSALVNSNVRFGAELLEGMIAAGSKKMVNVGTAWQHYEDSEYDPVDLYAATKQAFEDILAYYRSACGLNAITLKLFDTYGPNDRRPKLFPLLRSAARGNKPVAMSLGEQLLHLVYIDDVIDALLLAARKLLSEEIKNGTFAIDSQALTSLREVVRLYSDSTGLPIDVRWGAKPYRRREVMNPWRRGRRLPGWTPSVSLEEGIRKMEDAESSRIEH